MTRDTGQLTCDTNVRSIAVTDLENWCFEDSRENDYWLNELIDKLTTMVFEEQAETTCLLEKCIMIGKVIAKNLILDCTVQIFVTLYGRML